MRWLLLLHRYTGIAVGWLLAAWCLSGVVMLYVAFPEVSFEEHLSVLPELDFTACCAFESSLRDRDASPLRDFHVEMLGDEPVARLTTAFGATELVALRDGRTIETLTPAEARHIARALQREPLPRAAPEYVGPVERDQWTVTGYYERDRPLYRFALDDAAGTQWYLSSTTGVLAQATTRRERFWGWLGPVIHWSYPTLLRRNTALWIDFLIWTCSIGLFLTVLGIYIGIARLRRRRSGRWSPYRGINLWHHYLGLFFGVLVLTWTASGLLSVNPWGLLEGSGAGAEAARARGLTLTTADARTALARVAARDWPRETVRIETAPLAGKLYLLAYDRRGNVERLRADTFEPETLDDAQLGAVARELSPGHAILDAGLVHEGDQYYFDHHRRLAFPVYRVILADAERTRYYLDATTGRIVHKVDSGTRWYRWLFEGLHRLDFTPTLRQRPGWDVLMIALLAGVTAVCGTGTYMGFKSLLRRR